MLLDILPTDHEFVCRGEVVECRIPRGTGIGFVLEDIVPLSGGRRNNQGAGPRIQLGAADDPDHSRHGEVVVMESTAIFWVSLQAFEGLLRSLDILSKRHERSRVGEPHCMQDLGSCIRNDTSGTFGNFDCGVC